MWKYFNANLLWAVVATLAVAVFWVVSACANFYAGGTFGANVPLLFTTTSELFSYASLASDVLKTVMLFALTAAMFSRQWRVALVTGVMWVGCTGWSISSATRFVVQNNSEVVDGRGKSADEWTQLKEQISRLETRRQNVAEHRPKGVVEAEIASLLRTPGTGDCAVINGPVTSRVCPQVDELRKEAGNAESAQWLDGRLNELRQELKATAKVSSANPFADIVGGLFGIPPSEVTTNQALFFAFLLELISGLGLWGVWMAFIGVSKKVADDREAGKATQKNAESLQKAPEALAVPLATRSPRGPVGMPEVIEKAQARPQIEAPVETPPEGGGTPKADEPEVTTPEPEPTTVVNFPAPPKPMSKREKLKQKKREVDGRNRELVEGFIATHLDTDHPLAQIELTDKGGRKSGGTSMENIYQAFRRYCKAHGETAMSKSHCGRLVSESIDKARGVKGIFYGAVIRSEQKRKVA